jgi:hypothetical protein
MIFMEDLRYFTKVFGFALDCHKAKKKNSDRLSMVRTSAKPEVQTIKPEDIFEGFQLGHHA